MIFADPDVAARKPIEIASTIEPVQDGRIYVELLACTPCVCFETQTGKHLLGLSLTALGPTLTSSDVRFCAAVKGIADIQTRP